MAFGKIDDRAAMLKEIEGYFDGLADKVSKMEESQDVIVEMDLENYIWSADSKNHPRVLLNQLYESALSEQFDGLKSKGLPFYKEVLLKEIFDTKLENRRTFHVRYNKEEYYTDKDYNLIPFSEAGGLTEINAMRLIEKIQSRVESQRSSIISIAYFGKLMEEQELISYFRSRGIELCLHKYCLQAGSKYVYEDKKSQKIFHLIDLKELEQFVQEYDIVLLLDESSFYKQFGSKKKFREQRRTEFIKQYCEYGKNSENLIDRFGFYTKMYEEVLRYLADRKTEMSGAYEFDELVLRSFEGIIASVDAPCADIYCYISTGGRIANRDIEYLNICKDEFYQGKNLIVYKISKNSVSLNEQSWKKKTMSFEVWKLVKSVSNNFYKKTKISDDVDFWKGWTVEINTSGIKVKDNQIFRVPYQIHSKQGNKEITKIRELVGSIFELAFMEDAFSFSCVTVYLQTIVSSILLCNAENVDGILMAYMIKSGKKAQFVYTEPQVEKDSNKKKSGITLSNYRERKTVFTLIEGLNSIFIRDMKYKDQIIRFDFKEKYAPDLDEEIYEKYLTDIHRASESYGFTSMRTYLYT